MKKQEKFSYLPNVTIPHLNRFGFGHYLQIFTALSRHLDAALNSGRIRLKKKITTQTAGKQNKNQNKQNELFVLIAARQKLIFVLELCDVLRFQNKNVFKLSCFACV